MARIKIYTRLPKDGKNGKTNIAHLKKKKGVYFIYESSKLIYIGSSSTDLYRTILRHFQKWKDSKQLRRISYQDKLGKKAYTLDFHLMPRASKASIEKEEYKQVYKHKPRDNKKDVYCNITGNDCESKLSIAKRKRADNKASKKKKKAPIKKVDLVDDVPF